jgi:hypothetical protein
MQLHHRLTENIPGGQELWSHAYHGHKACRQAIRPGITEKQLDQCHTAERQLLDDPGNLTIMVTALVKCLPEQWCKTERTPGNYRASSQEGVQATLRALGWPAASITTLPKALANAADRQELLDEARVDPRCIVPTPFQRSPHIQLFSMPLPMTVKLATRLQQRPWREAVRSKHEKCVRGALQLGVAGEAGGGDAARPPRVPQLLQDLQNRLKKVWSLKWDNHWKETWWRLLLEGVKGAGGHGIALNGPCPCGWAPDPAHDQQSRAAAQRDHVFWHCPPAQAVRQVLSFNLPEGTALEATHVWLLQPPHASIHEEVWAVAALAALTTMAGARPYMWAKHLQHNRQVAAAPQPAAQPWLQAPGWAAPPGDPAAAAGLDSDDDQSPAAARPRGRRQAAAAAAAEEAPPPVMAARRACARFAAGVMDFVDVGKVPAHWVGKVQAEHCFMAVHSTPTAEGKMNHRLVCTLRMPGDAL